MKIISKIFTILCIMFLLWITASTIEIAAKNLKSDAQYSLINFWVLYMEVTE